MNKPLKELTVADLLEMMPPDVKAADLLEYFYMTGGVDGVVATLCKNADGYSFNTRFQKFINNCKEGNFTLWKKKKEEA